MKLKTSKIVAGLGLLGLILLLYYFVKPPRRPYYRCRVNSLPIGVKDSYNDFDFKNRMYCQFMGRLGNNLIEFASMYGLAQDTGKKMYFINRSLQGYRILYLFPNLQSVMKFVPCMPPKLNKVSDIAANKFAQNLSTEIRQAREDVIVSGYLGSYKYWWPHYESNMRETLTVNKDLLKQAEKYLDKLTSPLVSHLVDKREGLALEDWNSFVTYVGIQVRRGDKAYARDGWRLPEASYFKKAMEYFRNKHNSVIFVVVSEDKQWAKDNINTTDAVHSSTDNDLLELALLAKCDHVIMSSGTYSWWAAWLAGGQVVYYQNHTIKGSPVASWFNDDDFFLPHWIPMGD